MTTYQIQAGNNLTQIAKAHNTTVEALVNLNGITNPDLIKEGAIIKIPDVEQKQQPKPNSQEKMDEKLTNMQNQLGQMQQYMYTQPQNQQQTGLDGWDMFGFGLGAYAAGKVVEKSTPYLWNGAKAATKATANMGKAAWNTTSNLASNTASAVGNATSSAANKVSSAVKHAAKKVELEYAFNKPVVQEAVKNAANKTTTATRRVAKETYKTFTRSTKILNGQKTTIAGKMVKPLGKAGKVLGKAAVPVAVVMSSFEVGEAYNRGGAKEAVKTGAKCATGIASGWAGAKLGAAIGTAICPGIGTAIGGFIGGLAGFFAGEAAAKKVIS